MKLFATLETSRGKQVSISDNESITATVFDGNMKAYSVIIEITSISDPDHWKCSECGYMEEWDNYKDGTPLCPDCDIDMTHQKPVMGAIVTTREWRNRPKTNDKRKDNMEYFECQACGYNMPIGRNPTGNIIPEECPKCHS